MTIKKRRQADTQWKEEGPSCRRKSDGVYEIGVNRTHPIISSVAASFASAIMSLACDASPVKFSFSRTTSYNAALCSSTASFASAAAFAIASTVLATCSANQSINDSKGIQ